MCYQTVYLTFIGLLSVVQTQIILTARVDPSFANMTAAMESLPTFSGHDAFAGCQEPHASRPNPRAQ